MSQNYKLWLVFGVCLFLSIQGCETTAPSDSEITRLHDRLEMEFSQDIGVFLAGVEGYLCLPFRKIGLPNDCIVISIETTCDCVKPEIIEYLAPGDDLMRAVLVRYLPPDAPAQSPTDLNVEVIVKLHGGKENRFYIRMQHTEFWDELPMGST